MYQNNLKNRFDEKMNVRTETFLILGLRSEETKNSQETLSSDSSELETLIDAVFKKENCDQKLWPLMQRELNTFPLNAANLLKKVTKKWTEDPSNRTYKDLWEQAMYWSYEEMKRFSSEGERYDDEAEVFGEVIRALISPLRGRLSLKILEEEKKQSLDIAKKFACLICFFAPNSQELTLETSSLLDKEEERSLRTLLEKKS